MASKVNWKSKYEELRSKYMNAIDVSFRLGVEEGARNAEMEALQQQVAQMEEQAAMDQEAAMMGGEEEMMPEEMMGEEGMEEEMPEEELPPEEGDDLGGAIDELEDYVKNEGKINATDLLKSFHKSQIKEEDKKDKSKSSKKIKSLLKKWDNEEETEENNQTDDVIGQA